MQETGHMKYMYEVMSNPTEQFAVRLVTREFCGIFRPAYATNTHVRYSNVWQPNQSLVT